MLKGFPKVEKLRAPLAAGNEGQISPDRHAVLITFQPRGNYDEAAKYIDTDRRRHRGRAEGTSRLLRGRGRCLDREVAREADQRRGRAGRLIALPLTLLILLLVLGSLVAAFVPLLVGLTSVFATMGLVALVEPVRPDGRQISEVVLLIGLAVGVDYSLFYLRREREERKAGRGERAALEAAAATSGRAVLDLRLHRHDRDGRDVPLRRQDVHVVRDRRR